MSALLSGIIGQIWPYIAAALGAMAVAFGLHRKGKLDERKDAELKDYKHAQDVTNRADEARAAVADSIKRDGLRKPDQFQRD